ncbi:hypothetical protein COU77_00310 [Candidatus Peregrinibacteria bacterium CG10_big_fil_rev_8_21_14_0_10_49_16]|nr:MAG: hypothetical protein COU77_00310 [Candidatus Peregrinibacteria bacterium CG10_big_fil_rev_8_21_14_0_10_49_16]
MQELSSIGKLLPKEKRLDVLIPHLAFELLAYHQSLIILHIANKQKLSDRGAAELGIAITKAVIVSAKEIDVGVDIEKILTQMQFHQTISDYLENNHEISRLNEENFTRLLHFLGSSPSEANYILERAVISFTRLLGTVRDSGQNKSQKIEYEELIPRDAFDVLEWWTVHMTATTGLMESLTTSMHDASSEKT